MCELEGSRWDKVLLQLIKIFRDKLCEVSPHDMIKFCLENNIGNVAQDFLNKVKRTNLKDSALALQKKEEGNQKYRKKQFEESLSLYTETIFHATKDDECLPLAYSNRSIVLERKGYLSESLIDIDMALSHGYPKQKVENLILRKARCLLQLGDVEKAREILTEALKTTEKKEYHRVIENELQKIKDKKGEKKSTEFNLPEPVGGENENFSFASKYLNVQYNETKGRHVIANEDIQPGDVLFVEKPFAFVTFDKLCFNCCKNTIAPIPCWNCTGAYYCSPKCRDDFWKSVHSFECGFDELFRSIGIAHLGLRVILKASCCLEELKKILSNISEPVYENGNIIHISNTYEAVYNLVHNSEYYEAKEMFQYAVTALLLALYLKNHTSYFPRESDDEDLSLLTSVILRHILQLLCNGFCISETSVKSHEEQKYLERIAEIKTGTAVYTSASMMNHSCEPSVTKGFYLNYSIIRAKKAIKKGEEVFISYGPEARIMKKARRQEILSKQYFFKCTCQACLQKFDIQDKFMAFKCNECKGPSVPIEENPQNTICLSCGQISEIPLNIAKKQKKFYSLMQEGEVLSNDDIILSLEKYLEAWRTGREIFYKFHMDVARAADEVAGCLMELGEYKRCILFLRCCVRSVEERFGFLSFQLANEMKKLADIITVYIINNENAKDGKDLACEGIIYYRKAQKILSLIPEYKNFEDLNINIAVLEMNLRRLQVFFKDFI